MTKYVLNKKSLYGIQVEFYNESVHSKRDKADMGEVVIRWIVI